MRRLLFALTIGVITAGVSEAQERPRARDIGLGVGALPTGPLNAITDVAGVKVGHSTVIRGDSTRTGITAIITSGDNPFLSRVPASIVVGNGFGKLVGSTQVMELGELETPILTKPTPEDIQRRMQAAQPQQQPDMGMQQLQMQMQLANEKARMDGENAKRELEMERELKLAEIQQNGALKRYQIDAELNLKREQNLAEMAGGTALSTAHIGGMPG